MPGNSTVIHHQLKYRSRECYNSVSRIGKSLGIGDITNNGSGREFQERIISFHFKTVCSFSHFCRGYVIFFGSLVGRFVSGTGIHIYHTVNRIKFECSVRTESQLVIVHAEPFFFIRIGTPPVGSVTAGLTASKVSFCGGIHNPDLFCASGYKADVFRWIIRSYIVVFNDKFNQF